MEFRLSGTFTSLIRKIGETDTIRKDIGTLLSDEGISCRDTVMCGLLAIVDTLQCERC